MSLEQITKTEAKPDLEEIKKAKNPFGELIRYYIKQKHGLDRYNYLKHKSQIIEKDGLKINTLYSWIKENFDSQFRLKYLKELIDELQIPLEEVVKVNNGKNPFEADLEKFKNTRCPVGKLIDFYIDLKYGLSRRNYLKNESMTVKKEKLNIKIIDWINGGVHFPLRYLKSFVEELQIPLEEVIEANNGKNPFKPDLEEFKKAKKPLGKLLDFYINLKYGISRDNYLKNKSVSARKNKLTAATMVNWISENSRQLIPLKYLKAFANELQIPLEEMIKLNNGKDPFKPNLEKLKKSEKSRVKLIEFYIDLKEGIPIRNYLKNKSKIVTDKKLNVTTVEWWMREETLFPLKYFRAFVDELKIPLEEVIAVSGKNPFVPDLEEFKKEKNPLGKLIDFYIDLRYRFSRQSYLKNKSKIIKKEDITRGSATSWIKGQASFPLKYLKAFADELKIPYSEVNYLIDGDIEKGIAKAGNIRIKPNTDLILDSVKYYIKQYQKGQKERPAVFYPKSHPEFEKGHGISTKQIYRSLNK